MRKIAAVTAFLDDNHRAKITETAARCGFEVDFYHGDMLPEEKAAEYEVIFGMPKRRCLKSMTNLKWFCASFAGVDSVVDDKYYPNPDVLLTNSAGAYGTTIAEHIIMVTLMLLRRMPDFQQIVRERRWVQSLPMRSIQGSTITVLGTGDIGTNFARRAKAMGAAKIYGVRRSKKAGDPCYDAIYTHDELNEVLPKTEILVMALPSTPDTIGILSRERIALLPPEAIVVNVGRGTAIDQEALMEALHAGRIAGAALDVVVPEPIPVDHPLLKTPNLIITPHCAGNMALAYTCDKVVDMFLTDLAHYAKGEKLTYLVNRKVGY